MTEQNNSIVDVFRKQMSAYGDCDVETLMTTFAEGCVLRDMAEPEHPYEGRDAVRDFLVGYFADLANVDVTIKAVTANQDTVIGELDVTADWVSEPFSRENPRRIRLQYAVADTIENDLVTYERFYWDSEGLRQQLK